MSKNRYLLGYKYIDNYIYTYVYLRIKNRFIYNFFFYNSSQFLNPGNCLSVTYFQVTLKRKKCPRTALFKTYPE